MGPAELLDYDRSRLRGVVIEEGSQTSHVAIVARALNIPLVGGIEGVTDHVASDDAVIVDGDGGQVFLRPAGEHITAYREKLALREQQQAQFAALKDEPAMTLDNQRVALHMNAGLLVEMPHLEASGADGIGLFRTELHFMISATLPRLPAQVALYREVLERADGKPVVFRTLDIGGDKALPYLKGPREANPALGWRAIRVALDRPALLRYQIRALLTAAAGRDLHLMFPMVADVAEFERARALIDRESRWLTRLGRALPTHIRVGTMLEVPSLAWQLPALLSRVDFISVGSNDLVQFFFASDRDNPRLASRYDALSPSLLTLLRHIVETCTAADVPVTLCGEMAARPLEAMALVGLGFRSMSMPAAAIGPVKRMVRSVDAADLGTRLQPLLNLPDRSLRGRLETYARENGVFI
jgi:phosphotransferase system enzyme I (PtsP)